MIIRSSVKVKNEAVAVEEQVSRMMKAKSRALSSIKRSASVNDHELKTFVCPVFPKETFIINVLNAALKSLFIFDILSDHDRLVLVDAMSKSTFEEGSLIIEQGNRGDFFYVVESGTVNFIVDSKKVGGCTKGSCFGELALLYDCPRAATCVAESACVLWKVDKKTFQLLVASRRENKNKDLTEILRTVPLLSDLDQTLLSTLADSLGSITYSAGKRIVAKGTEGEIFYIIQEGKVKVHDIGLGDSTFVDQYLKDGDFFGEKALLTGDPRGANVTAVTDCTLLCLSRMEFETSLGKLEDLMKMAARKRVLKSAPIFVKNNDLSSAEVNRLNDLFTKKTYTKGTVIEQKGNQKTELGFYIIESGKIVIVNDNGTVNNLTNGDNFQTIQSEVHAIADRTIMAEEDVELVVLTEENIKCVIKDTNRLGRDQSYRIRGIDKTMKLSEIKKMVLLGKGAFGHVWMVCHEPTNQRYALKELSKYDIIEKEQVKGLIREKNVLASIHHPLICNLVATFQDQTKVYMLQDLILGGELMTVLQKSKDGPGLPVSSAKFYGSCVLSALMHMHHVKIVYRDLKPENAMICEKGYCLLIDMGFAKVVYDKTYTMCGTPEYLSPEIILSQGYNTSVDVWAFGILLYELIAGHTPFIEEGHDQMSLFKAIVRMQFTFKDPKFDLDSKNLISKLLRKKWHHRIGCQTNGNQQIKDHMFFDDVNFEEFEKKEVDEELIPWKPTIKNDHDTGNFEKVDETMSGSGKNHISKADNKLFESF